MSICANSLLNSFIFGPRSGYISLDSEHCQVSICENSLRNSFIFGFLELSYFSFLYHFIVIICPEAQGRFVKQLQGILQNPRPPEAAWHALLSMIINSIISGNFSYVIRNPYDTSSSSPSSSSWPSSLPYYSGSVGGCSMDMWCPYGIGRESWDRVKAELVDQDPFPLEGMSHLAVMPPVC